LISAIPIRTRPILVRLFKRQVASALLLLTASSLANASDVGDFLGRRVTKVEVLVEGEQATGLVELKSLLDVAPGQDYSPVRIHDSLVRLHHSGLVSAARVDAIADGPSGVILKFYVRPQARITNVAFEGKPIFPASELRARLNQLDVGERVSPGAISRGLGDLIAFYSARGYYQARITSDIRLDASNTSAVVVYAIDPGEQAVVSNYSLEITGARVDLPKPRKGQKVISGGQPFTQALVQEEMDRIRDAYLAKDYLAVRVNSNITPDVNNNQVSVEITVASGPQISVDVDGLKISDKDKRQTLPFYRSGGLDEFTLEEGARRLTEYAQRKGYFFATVKAPDAPDPKQQSAHLVYVVDAAQRYKLSDIEINGLNAIRHATLEEQMKSRTATLFSFGDARRGITSDDMLRQDSNLILKRLREIGYRRSHVDVRRGVSIDGKRLIITFDVRQGPRAYIEEIGMRGNSLMTTDELKARVELKRGDPLTAVAVARTADRLLSAYTTRGYFSAEVSASEVELGGADGRERVRLIYTIGEGHRARIHSVLTRGNAVTSSDRLANDFYLFRKGDWLRADRLAETERQLYETNAFNSVAITSEPLGAPASGIEERDVTVNLLEAKRRDVIFGFGYQSNPGNVTVPGLDFLKGARGLIQLTHSNMFGRLYTGSAQVRVSQNELFGQLSFENPRPFGTQYPGLVSLIAQRLAEKSFRSDRYTAIIQAERKYSNDFIAYLSYYFERVSIFDLQGPIEEVQRNERPIRLGRIGPSFLLDKRDNKFDPSSGSQTLGSFYIASTALGGNEQFIKLVLEHDRYFPIPKFRDMVFSVSGRIGLAAPFGGNDSLPISERFFAGGARDLRGFGFEEAGPQTTVDVDGVPTQFPLGGNALIVINNELRFPIYKILEGTVFSDTGNVFKRIRDISLGDLTQTLGFGVRVKTPIGPVRMELGFLVANKPPGLSGHHFHFTIGQTF
jgi:outer membrane protein insertion porin family